MLRRNSARRAKTFLGIIATSLAIACRPLLNEEPRSPTDEQLASSCHQGNGADCERLAQGKRGERAFSLMEAACANGAMSACQDIGAHLVIGEFVLRDEKRGVLLLKNACDKNQGAACAFLGRYTLSQDSSPASGAKARAYVEKACRLNDAFGCGAAGVAWRDGLGGMSDARQADEFFGRACQLKQGDACVAWANLAIDERLPATGRIPAFDLYLRACKLGSMKGCAYAGLRLSRGGGGTRADPVRASALLTKACNGNEVYACAELGRLEYEQGHSEGFGRLKMACEQHSALGCLYYADVATRNATKIADLAGRAHALGEAAQLYEQACKQAGEPASNVACIRLGDMLREGTGVTRDLQRAAELFRKTCPQLGEGCLRLGEMFEQGELFGRDLDQAASFYEQACKASTEEGCRKLARLRAERTESGTQSTPPSPATPAGKSY